jgi:hypothetical protein
MNRAIEKSGGFFPDSVSKSKEMVWYPVLSVGLYPAMDTRIGRAWGLGRHAVSARIWV